MNVDRLFINGRLATMRPDATTPYGLVEAGALAVSGGGIVAVGTTDDIASRFEAPDVVDLGGRLMTPALVDCHTHLVFAGERVSEFERRLAGTTYAELAREGGGIASTVAATRAASLEELTATATAHLKDLVASGVGTAEIKSGYDLTAAGERRMLEVAAAAAGATGVRVSRTLLAAHTIPPEYAASPDEYVSLVADQMIPDAAAGGWADSVDAFLEHIAFDEQQVRRVFDAARNHGLAVRLHADQLSDGGGAALAAEYGALSADHLEHAAPEGLSRMAEAGTVAVVIPGASVFLNEPAVPAIDTMRSAGVRIAIASDLNPGTSPVRSLQAAMWLAAAKFRLTPEEILAGVTRHAAAALGLADAGELAEGMRADLAVWDASLPAALTYWLGTEQCRSVWVGGQQIFDRSDA